MSASTNDQVKASRAAREANGEMQLKFTAPTWISATNSKTGEPWTEQEIKAIKLAGWEGLRASLAEFMTPEQQAKHAKP